MRIKLKAAISIIAGAAMLAASPVLAQGQTKELSDKSVAILMEYAWLILPSQMRVPDRTIKVDKSQKDKVLVPVETARDVIKAGYMSAQAQLCDMMEAQAANYDALMRFERAKKKWTDQQLLYITTLHRMTIHMAAGKLRVVEKSKDEQLVILEAIEPQKSGCTDDKRKEITDKIVAYVKAAPILEKAETPPAAPQPTPAAAKDGKK